MIRHNMVNPNKRGASPPRGWRSSLAVSVGRSLLPANTLLECVDTVHQTQHCGCLHRGRRLADLLHRQDKSVFNPNNTGWWRGGEERRAKSTDEPRSKERDGRWKHTSEKLLEVRLDDVWVCCLAENLQQIIISYEVEPWEGRALFLQHMDRKVLLRSDLICSQRCTCVPPGTRWETSGSAAVDPI